MAHSLCVDPRCRLGFRRLLPPARPFSPDISTFLGKPVSLSHVTLSHVNRAPGIAVSPSGFLTSSPPSIIPDSAIPSRAVPQRAEFMATKPLAYPGSERRKQRRPGLAPLHRVRRSPDLATCRAADDLPSSDSLLAAASVTKGPQPWDPTSEQHPPLEPTPEAAPLSQPAAASPTTASSELLGAPPVLPEAQASEQLVQAETDFLMFTGYLAKYMTFMLATGAALETFVELADRGGQDRGTVLWFCWAAGVVLGCMVGARRVLERYARCGPRNVVVTGSTRGLGKALAREFLMHGDSVIITSRSESAVGSTLKELQGDMEALGKSAPAAALWVSAETAETGKGEGPDRGRAFHGRHRVASALIPRSSAQPSGQVVVGVACDVQSEADVHALAQVARRELGHVDVWVNNAGTNSGFKPFMDSSAEEVKQVVFTNLVGSMLCTREAFRLLKEQRRGGHIFNMEGAGSEGGGTPRYAVYGATKSALRQFHYSLLQECRGSRVGIHTASPGMVLTDLLLTGSTLENKQAFNIICEQPETVARALVPRIRAVKGTGKAINYLTPPRIILAIITAWLRRGRWFDEDGQAVYAAEADRLRALAQQQQSPLEAIIEALPSTAWVSLLGSSAIAVYLVVTAIGELNG